MEVKVRKQIFFKKEFNARLTIINFSLIVCTFVLLIQSTRWKLRFINTKAPEMILS